MLEQIRTNLETIECLEQHLSKELDKFPSGVSEYTYYLSFITINIDSILYNLYLNSNAPKFCNSTRYQKY